LTLEERAEMDRRLAAGETLEEVARGVRCDPLTVFRWVQRTGGLRPYQRRRSPLRLSPEEREQIAVGIARGESASAIARRLGRAPSTVTRELNANGGRRRYVACRADTAALARARRPKPAKLANNKRLRTEVVARLEQRWSPQQIAARLVIDFPDDPEMRVSHETIYQSLFVQSRGALRRELTACLRSGRIHRRARGSRPGGSLRDMIRISARPAEVKDRAVPGHWEGDLIIGKAGRTAIATLVERQSRFTMLLALPDGRTAESVRDALTATIPTLPAALRRSITWDQGKEMADHARFTVDTGVAVYFCDPSSPWQRGTNENTNGLLRQYFPKGTDLSEYNQAALDAVADELNGRPRQTLAWVKPSEAFNQLVATTA
jgi:IS30 family transposase